MNGRFWLLIAGLSGAAAVALGAYGAHGLAADETIQGQFDTANRYHMWHTLALLAASLLAQENSGGFGSRGNSGGGVTCHLAALAFIAGIALFCAPLYAATITEITDYNFLTPWGGVAFMVGWVFLALSAFRRS